MSTDKELVAGATNVAEYLAAITEAFSDCEAIVDSHGRITYSEMNAKSRELARTLLGAGVTKYSRVAIHAPNGIDWVVAWFAITRTGAVAVPISVFSTGPEFARILRHADCQVLLVRQANGREHPLDSLVRELPSFSEQEGPTSFNPDLPYLRTIIDLTPGTAHPAARPTRVLGQDTSVVSDRLLDACEHEVHAADPATMVYTSGSTSAPKGVIHSHASVMAQTRVLAEDLSFDRETRNFTTMPLFWVGGLALSLLPTFARGGLHAFTESLDPAQILELIEREKLNRVFVYPPRNLDIVISHPDYRVRDLTSIGRGTPGLPIDYDETKGISNTTDGLRMGLGMSESFGPYWWGSPEAPDDLLTPPLRRLSPGWEIKVVREDGELAGDSERGEIRIRGPHLAVGLQKVERSSVFDEDGYYRTGDIGLVDGELIRFRGRAGDMVKINGANVTIPEVVEAIKLVPGVQEAFVCAVPDAVSGSVLFAAVVPVPGAPLSSEDVLNRIRHDLAPYKIPAFLDLMDSESVPMTPSGRLDQPRFRDLLKRRFSESSPK